MHFSRFFRFIVSGGLNTAITYGIYLALLQLMPYQFSYTIAYVSGITISYVLSRSYVFRSHYSLRSIFISFGLCCPVCLWYAIAVAVDRGYWIKRQGRSASGSGSDLTVNVCSLSFCFFGSR